MNPNPSPYKHIMPKQEKKGNWQCNVCKQKFESKNEMRNHFKDSHKELTRSRGVKICKLCGAEYVNIRKHNKVCPNRSHVHHFTEEERAYLSEKRRKYLRENPDKHPWKGNSKFISVPCEKLKNYLRENDIKFEEEYTDPNWNRLYSMDIALLDKKIDIEVNGNQHYNGNLLKERYQIRHDYLESQGWTVIELHYSKCFKDDELLKILEKVKE